MSTTRYSTFPKIKYGPAPNYYKVREDPVITNPTAQNYRYFVYRENKENAQLLLDIWNLLDSAIKNMESTENAEQAFSKEYRAIKDFKQRIEEVAIADNLGVNVEQRIDLMGRRNDYSQIKSQAEQKAYNILMGDGKEQDIAHFKTQTIADAAISVLNDLRLELSICYDKWQSSKNKPEMTELLNLVEQYHKLRLKWTEDFIDRQKCFKKTRCNAQDIDVSNPAIYSDYIRLSTFNCPQVIQNSCEGECDNCCRCKSFRMADAKFFSDELAKQINNSSFPVIKAEDGSNSLLEQIQLIIYRSAPNINPKTSLVDMPFPSLGKLMYSNPYLFMSSKQQLYDIHVMLTAFDNEITKYQGEPDILTKLAFQVQKPSTTPLERRDKYKALNSLQERLDARVQDGSLYNDRESLRESQIVQQQVQYPPQQDMFGYGSQKSMQTLFEIGEDAKMDSSTIDMLRALTGDFNLIN